MRRIAWVLLVGLMAGPIDPLVAEARTHHKVKALHQALDCHQDRAYNRYRGRYKDRAPSLRHGQFKVVKRRVIEDVSAIKPHFTAIAPGVGQWSRTLQTAAGPVRLFALRIDLRLADVAPVVARNQGRPFGLERTSVMAQRTKALAGINGSFFSPRNRQPMDLLIVNGRVLAHPTRRPALVLKEDGTASIVPATRHQQLPVIHAVGGGPTLLAGGKLALSGWPSSMGGRAPRTAAGLTRDGKVLLLTIDGRSNGSVGATIREEARYIAALGAREAINLDGGGSSTMVVKGRVINRPSDGYERPVSNALMVFTKKAVAVRPVAPRKVPYSGFGFNRS